MKLLADHGPEVASLKPYAVKYFASQVVIFTASACLMCPGTGQKLQSPFPGNVIPLPQVRETRSHVNSNDSLLSIPPKTGATLNTFSPETFKTVPKSLGYFSLILQQPFITGIEDSNVWLRRRRGGFCRYAASDSGLVMQVMKP